MGTARDAGGRVRFLAAVKGQGVEAPVLPYSSLHSLPVLLVAADADSGGLSRLSSGVINYPQGSKIFRARTGCSVEAEAAFLHAEPAIGSCR